MLDFIRLHDHVLLEQHARRLPRWIYQSGPAFFSTLFGDQEKAEAVLASWIKRRSSEFSGLRATVGLCDGQPAGMFIALAGSETAACRRADILALVQQTPSSERGALVANLKDLGELTAPVEKEDYYLRTIVVDEGARGRGFGRAVVERAIADGRQAGFTCFRLDVDAENEPALRLYHGLGFQKIFAGAAPAAGLRMYSMRRCD